GQAVHGLGPFLYMTNVLPDMIRMKKGRVINIASLGGTRVEPYLSAYCMGKASEIRLTEQVAAEVKQHGLSTFAIEPGTVYTDMAEATLSDPTAQRYLPDMIEFLKQVKERQDPAAGFAKCARMCLDLASGR